MPPRWTQSSGSPYGGRQRSEHSEPWLWSSVWMRPGLIRSMKPAWCWSGCGLEVGDARPTAVNLRWAVDRTIDAALGEPAVRQMSTNLAPERLLADEALAVGAEDAAGVCRDRPVRASSCWPMPPSSLPTATRADWQLPASALRWRRCTRRRQPASRSGCWPSETRPLMQGARLTAWELDRRRHRRVSCGRQRNGVAHRRWRSGRGDRRVRIASPPMATLPTRSAHSPMRSPPPMRESGSTSLRRPPPSTQRFLQATASSSSSGIPTRCTAPAGRRLTPAGAGAVNPAFDVTPARLITAIITDAGVLRPPYGQSIAAALAPIRGAGGRTD